MSYTVDRHATPSELVRISNPVTREIVSPAFSVNYPVVFNPELIGDHALREMEVSWTRGTAAAQPVKIFHLRDVIVVGDGLVFDRELRLLANASPWLSPELVQAAFDVLRTTVREGSLCCQDEFTILAKRRAPNNYGHYLLEMLPLAIIGRTLYGDRTPRYLLPRVAPAMQDVVLRSLRLGGIDLGRIILQGVAEPMHFDEVVVIIGLSDHGVYMSPLSVRAIASLGAAIPSGPLHKLFISRPTDGAGERMLLNQLDIQAV